MAEEDDDILAHFKEQLVQSKHAPAIAAKSREDFIERAQENFGSLFTFVQSVDEAIRVYPGDAEDLTYAIAHEPIDDRLPCRDQFLHTIAQ